MENNNLCRLCFKLKSTKHLINIFDKNKCAIKFNIAEVLSKYFWFKVNENDGLSQVICRVCWRKTENFHLFYNNIKIAYNDFYKIHSIPTNNDNNKAIIPIINKIEHVENPLNVEINFIKIEDNNNFNTIVDDESTGNSKNALEENFNMSTFSAKTTIIEPDIKCLINETILNDNCSQSQSDDCVDKTSNANDDNNDDSDYQNNEEKFINASMKRKTTTSRKTVPKITLKNLQTMTLNNTEVRDGDISTHSFEINDLSKTDINAEKTITQKEEEVEDAQIREYFSMSCEICNCDFFTFTEAKTHYRIKHSTSGYLTCCKRKFFRRGAILEHIMRHLNPEAYKCLYCDKLYSNKIALKNHIETHIPYDSRPYKCDICPKSFLKSFHLTHHKKYRHYKEEDKKFVCDDCGKSFMAKSILTSHIRGVHENAYLQICDICARVFKSKQVFEFHRDSNCGTDMQRKSQCNICGAWLKNEHSLRSHLSRHNDTIQNCPLCGKETPNRNALGKHMRYVHSDRTHICKLCNKAFKQSIGLKEHMASHTGEVLYTCPYCPKTFNSGANMHSHRKKMHPIEWQQNRGQRIIKSRNDNL